MATTLMEKKILILDEHGFSRVCSAILASGGYQTEVVNRLEDLPAKLGNDSISVIVTSYPFGLALFESLRRENLPIIILSDGIDERLMGILSSFQNSCCMIKPVDYDRFKDIVRQAFEGTLPVEGGYSIV